MAPGDFLLRDGYRVDFQTKKPLKIKDIIKAKQNDIEKKRAFRVKQIYQLRGVKRTFLLEIQFFYETRSGPRSLTPSLIQDNAK